MADEESVRRPVVFKKRSKKPNTRKPLRYSSDEDEHAPQAASDNLNRSPEEAPPTGSEQRSSTALSRFTAQTPAASRRAGLHFSSRDLPSSVALRRSSDDDALAGDQRDPKEKPFTLDNKFVKESGLVTTSTNQHMTDYIDSEYEKLQTGRSRSPRAAAPRSTQVVSRDRDYRTAVESGQLNEVDLGPQARSRNLAMTQVAVKRSSNSPATEDQRKAHLGHRSKKARRQPPERSEADIRRDNAVEQIFAEQSNLLFSQPQDIMVGRTDSPGNTDEQVAADFERDFLETMLEQNQPKKPPGPAAMGKDQPPKGPKLGGSRSARAAVHAQERAAASKKH